MTERPSCESCRYWDNSVSSVVNPDDTGRCVRKSPGFDDRTGSAVWPFTEANDWCGEHVSSQEIAP